MAKTKVYFTRKISPANVIKLYEALGVEMTGNVAIKVHTGEAGNQNFIRPNFWKPMVDKIGGNVVECCTAYPGMRVKPEDHKKVLDMNGWNARFEGKMDIMDAEEDYVLDFPEGKILKKDYVGKNILNYDSCIVLSHFKGHPGGGFGGALKQLSIGFGSSVGKSLIHSAGTCAEPCSKNTFSASQADFVQSMADAAGAVVKYFRGKGQMAFVTVAKDISVDCDCIPNAPAPCMADIGIFASTDPVAIDKACLDMVYNSDDPGRDTLVERIESRLGQYIIPDAVALGYGTDDYELVDLDK